MRSLPSETTLQPKAIVSLKVAGMISIFFFFRKSMTSSSVVSRQTAATFSVSMQTMRSMWT